MQIVFQSDASKGSRSTLHQAGSIPAADMCNTNEYNVQKSGKSGSKRIQKDYLH